MFKNKIIASSLIGMMFVAAMLGSNRADAKKSDCVVKGTTLVKYTGADKTYTVPENVKNIGKNAFKSAKNLKKVVISKNVKNIDKKAFDGAAKLTDITVAVKNKKYFSRDGALYIKKSKKLRTVPAAKKTLILAAKYTDKYTLTGIDNINELYEGTTLVLYRGNAKKYTVPSNINRIAADAFETKNLREIIINKNVKEIDGSAFKNAEGLLQIEVKAENKKYTAYDGALYSKDEKELIKVPNGKESINLSEKTELCTVDAFQNAKLASVNITRNCFINFASEGNPFNGCSSLKEITVHAENPYYTSVDGVLYTKNMNAVLLYPSAKSAADKFEIPERVYEIGKYAFLGADIKQIVIPESLGKIGESAFYNSAVNNVIFKGKNKALESSEIWTGFFPAYAGTLTFMDDTVVLPAYQALNGWLGGKNDYTICSRANSTAHKYASENNLRWQEMK